jgi:hypothetical protein
MSNASGQDFVVAIYLLAMEQHGPAVAEGLRHRANEREMI